MKGLQRKLLKKATVGFLAAGMILALAGCGASTKDMAYDSAASMSMEAGEASSNGSGFVEYKSAVEESIVEAERMDTVSSATENGSTRVAVTDRKLIKTVDMTVETQGFDELMTAIEDQVAALGGYIESMNTYNGSAYSSHRSTKNADMTLRIPKENLDSFLNTVSDISNVVRRSDSVEDVTLAYVDLESHKEALRTEQTRLLELLEKAETIEDIITIEARLSDVRYQLESMESQLRTYDNQVDYSTVYLIVDEVEIYTPVEEETAWERISEGFMESLDNIGNGFVEFGIWFVVHIPYLVMWAVLLGAFIGLIVWLIKHSTKPPKNTSGERVQQGNQQQAAAQGKPQSEQYFEQIERENPQKQ